MTDIHERYLVHGAHGVSREGRADTLAQLIRANEPMALLEFLQSVPFYERISLLNAPSHHCDGMLPINFALSRSAHHLVLMVLLRGGASSDRPRHLSLEAPLLVAVRAGLVNASKVLLAAHANVNVLDDEGYSVLHWACRRKNPLMARLILRSSSFSYHNHDRNSKRISPLGMAIESGNLQLVNELLRHSHVDPDPIDTTTHRHLYDIAAECGFYEACAALETAFVRRHPHLNKRQIVVRFHAKHECRVELVQQHQLRTFLFSFADDPRGAFTPLDDPTMRMRRLPRREQWTVVRVEGSLDPDGWVQSLLLDDRQRALAVSLSGDCVVDGGRVFQCIDNYRVRLLARVIKHAPE